jgi:hypothetical protein
LVERVEGEPFRLGCSARADELVRREPYQCLQATAETLAQDYNADLGAALQQIVASGAASIDYELSQINAARASRG